MLGEADNFCSGFKPLATTTSGHVVAMRDESVKLCDIEAFEPVCLFSNVSFLDNLNRKRTPSEQLHCLVKLRATALGQLMGSQSISQLLGLANVELTVGTWPQDVDRESARL